MKNDIFKCIYVSGSGKEYDGGDWRIITDTKKSLYLKCIREPKEMISLNEIDILTLSSYSGQVLRHDFNRYLILKSLLYTF